MDAILSCTPAASWTLAIGFGLIGAVLGMALQALVEDRRRSSSRADDVTTLQALRDLQGRQTVLLPVRDWTPLR